MSRQTLSRIPKDIQHIFKVYETASQLYKPYGDKLVRQFVDRTGSYYEQFNRRKLLTERSPDGLYTPIFNSRDFPPVTRDIVARIFESPLQLEEKLDLLPVPEDALDDEPIFSDRHKTAKHFSDYQAKILSLFASYYTPLKTVESSPAKKSLTWYQRLLSNTPIVFFLSQKQRLMTELSLRGINQPLKSLRVDLDQICRRFVKDPNRDKRIRNYHLTDLVTTDIFKLAVENESSITPNSAMDPISGAFEDRLCEHLHGLRRPEILGPDGKPCSRKTIAQVKLDVRYPIDEIESVLGRLDDTQRLPSIFPYDILYNDIYMMTIEGPVFKDNHGDLLDLLHDQEHFNVFAARISRAETSQLDFTVGAGQNCEKAPAPTYESLLQWAEQQQQRTSTPLSNVPLLLERIGEWGLVEVEESPSNSAFYVFEESKKKKKKEMEKTDQS